MPALDVVKDIRSGLGPGPILPTVDPLTLEHPKETLGRRIIGTTADGAHAARNVMRRQELLVLLRRELAAAIGMENDGRPARPLPHGHQDGLDHELPVLPRTHRPAHHEAGIQVQHDAEIQPVLRGADVGDVRHPFGVRGSGREIPLQMILRPRGWGTGRLPAPASPLRHALQAGSAHQARHPVAATVLASVTEFFPHPWAADHAIVLGMLNSNGVSEQ